jgi:hypothetical protein
VARLHGSELRADINVRQRASEDRADWAPRFQIEKRRYFHALLHRALVHKRAGPRHARSHGGR